MPTGPLSRRRFLALTGGAALLAACGESRDHRAGDDGTAPDPPGPPGTTDLAETNAGIVSSDLYASGDPQRFAFAILARDGYASGAPARVALGPPGTLPDEASREDPPDPESLGLSWIATDLRDDGLPSGRGIYTAAPVFDVPGIWDGWLDHGGTVRGFAFSVRDQPAAPVPGDAAVRIPSATVDEPLGVDPICTLASPCPFHERSLADIVGAGRPVVVQFSTPARCATQYCGPVLDTLVDAAAGYRDRVEIVHVEIYPDLRAPEPVAAVGPDGWNLPTEPWMYAIAGDGTILARLDGAFDASETRELLEIAVSSG